MSSRKKRICRGPRTRSFGGCDTCRLRHVKCDEIRPICGRCARLGLVCEGYDVNVIFEFDGTGHAGSSQFRRPILSEVERRRMSDDIASKVHPDDVLSSLAKIDEACENDSPTASIQLNLGPFDVFSIREAYDHDEHRESVPVVRTCDELSVSGIDFDSLGGLIDTSETSLLPWSLHEFYDMAEFSLAGNMMLDHLATTAGRFEDVSDLVPDLGVDSNQINSPPCEFVLGMSDSCSLQEHFGSPSPTAYQPTIKTSTAPQLLQNAVQLLQHYTSNVIKLLSPSRDEKTPWHVIFVPLVKQSLAALTLQERLDHATLCGFYSTLAISSLSLAGMSGSSSWLQSSSEYKQLAREQAKQMLREAYHVPKVTKYKTLLVALLSMVRLCIITGNRDQADCYLLETEKLIRLRGLHRAKSRKRRLLHHCYAFERFLHESNLAASANHTHRTHILATVGASGLVVPSQDSGVFRLINRSNLDEEEHRIKTQEMGENDLHLEQMGIWPASQYADIFGIPEDWVTLLSFTIRLGNEKDVAESGTADNPMKLKDFLSQARAIEDIISRKRQENRATGARVDGTIDTMQRTAIANKPILDIMYEGLAIYFYRRIFDVDSSVLQPMVEDVITNLSLMEQTDLADYRGSFIVSCAVFIAGCEAPGSCAQQRFAQWYEGAYTSSGLVSFKKTLQALEKIWHGKQAAGRKGFSWFEMVRSDAKLQQCLCT